MPHGASAAGARISAYVLKKDSPSCGMQGVMVHDANGSATRSGVGAFAAALLALFRLPVRRTLADAAPRNS